MTERHSKSRWFILCAIVLALIIVPFLIFGKPVEQWVAGYTAGADRHAAAIALVLGSLLAGDILLPVPSSIVSTACGFLLGFWPGALTSLAGMAVSCGIGFYLARGPFHAAAGRLVDAGEMRKLETLTARYGIWMLVMARPVPVLAEASVLFAGLARMPAGRFLLLTTLSNLGISLVYSAVGAFSAQVQSFLLAFGASLVLPGIAMGIGRLRPRRAVPVAHET